MDFTCSTRRSKYVGVNQLKGIAACDKMTFSFKRKFSLTISKVKKKKKGLKRLSKQMENEVQRHFHTSLFDSCELLNLKVQLQGSKVEVSSR